MWKARLKLNDMEKTGHSHQTEALYLHRYEKISSESPRIVFYYAHLVTEAASVVKKANDIIF